MKRTLILFLICTFLIAAALPFAAASEDLPLLIDNAGLLSASEGELLTENLKQLQQEYQMDIVILTEHSLGGISPSTYADDYFDDNGYGFGPQGSGILFLLAMEERDLYISTCGEGIYALTDYGIQESTGEVVSYFSDGEYYGGFSLWLVLLENYLNAYRSGTPLDGTADDPEVYFPESETVVSAQYQKNPSFLLSLLIGLAAAGITVGIMYASMNTKRKQRGASDYLASGSFSLRTRQDIFLFSNVHKTARPKNTGSGGSSVHRSSGGRRHGGGGRKF